MHPFEPHLQWIDLQQDHMLDLLQHWSSINTFSYNLTGLAAFSTQLIPTFHTLSPFIREIPLPPHATLADDGMPHAHPLAHALSIQSPPAQVSPTPAPHVLLAIHFDTVFPPTHPFQTVTRLDANTLQGPGVCDAKGGLLVLLFALRALENSPFAHRIAWEVLLNSDEELGSPGSGQLFTDAARRNDLALLFEPALPDGSLVSARKGSGNYTLVARGKSAHAGRDILLGRNAIHSLAQLTTRLVGLQADIPGLSVNTGTFHGGIGGATNIVPDFALARLNVRAHTAEQQLAFESRLQLLLESANADGIAIESHGQFHCPPKPLTPNTLHLLEQFRDCAHALSIIPTLTWRETGGVCDGNRTAAAGCPTVDSLGPRGGNMHTDQEFILIDSLLERTRLTALFLMRLAAGEIPLPSKILTTDH